jgi:phenylacetate-coenzyme A ligase PaaK-like adenylate-forming protein
MNFKVDEIISRLEPYSLAKDEKENFFNKHLNILTQHHYEHCLEYKKILDILNYNPNTNHQPKDIPFIPVRLFKDYELLSVPKENIVKTLTSSGTTGQQVSKIFLDKSNAQSQTRVLSNIITSYIGKSRLPLLLLDTELVKKDRSMYSARGAGIIGFTTFGRDTFFALDDDMKLKLEQINEFLERHAGSPILIFGYTYLIWQYVVMELENQCKHLNIKDGILFHIGGWKKLKDQSVNTSEFNRRIHESLGNMRVYNFYGMAEQLGSVFVECEYGRMHCSIFSNVFVRNPRNFELTVTGKSGLLELQSLLPTSYPGHSLLTEDEGTILGEDDCPCGRLGKTFMIHGRVKDAEVRGCSDTYEKHQGR